MLSAIYRFEGEYFSEGVIENGLLKAKKYSHLWKTSKTLKKMSLVFNNNKIMSLDQEPIEKESLRINIFNLEGVNDPISSFLQIIKNGDSALVVDGRRLYMMNPIYNKDIDQTTISLEGYSNLWTDHKRSKFEKIAFKKNSGDLLPTKIFIYFDGRVFKLEQS